MTTKTPDKEIAAPTKKKTLPELLNDEGTRKRFADMLGKDARSFQQNILTVYANGGEALMKCDPESIIAGAAISASINLSILPSLGQSCIVPYDGVAQWQLMTRGVIALAMRSEQYRKINLARVYDGQLIEYDEFKGLVHLDAKAKKSDRVQGYYFYFELLNGFTRESYWSAKKCVEHGLRFSKSFQSGKGKWTEDPEFTAAGSVKKWLAAKAHFLTEGSGTDAMSAKTAVKNDLTKWGPLETRIREIINIDQAAIRADGTPDFIDTTAEHTTEKVSPAPPPTSGKDQKPPAGDRIAWTRADAVKKGIDAGVFDVWLGAQEGDQEAVATAAEKEWQKLAKALKAGEKHDAFVLASAADKSPKEKTVTFKVYSVVEASEFNGEPACCIRDTSEPAVKRYTDVASVIKAAHEAKASGEDLTAKALEKPSGKNVFDWLTKLA